MVYWLKRIHVHHELKHSPLLLSYPCKIVNGLIAQCMRLPSNGERERFVINTCRRLKEKKSYMVYTAVACLGVCALSDLINEVEAIQACGGQMTVDGRRFRTGGGVLWSIIKVREPNAYKEIIKKAKEFEKQFRQPNVKQPPVQKKEDSFQGDDTSTFASGHQGTVSDKSFSALQMQDRQHKPSGSEEKRNSVHDRLRIHVSYDDDLLGLSADNDTA
ncbi:hypothetical protein GLYMA_14G092900v4 [Glycine max]|nr:hypothetical protein GLYMA_14G092900v4 [Glycine max]KAH1093800.1 hypothetical protein GYH30_039501 [Glycine max]